MGFMSLLIDETDIPCLQCILESWLYKAINPSSIHKNLLFIIPFLKLTAKLMSHSRHSVMKNKIHKPNYSPFPYLKEKGEGIQNGV